MVQAGITEKNRDGLAEFKSEGLLFQMERRYQISCCQHSLRQKYNSMSQKQIAGAIFPAYRIENRLNYEDRHRRIKKTSFRTNDRDVLITMHKINS